MKRVASGVLAVLLLLGSFFVEAPVVSADPAGETQETTTQTAEETASVTVDPTTGDSTENSTPSDSATGDGKGDEGSTEDKEDEKEESKYTGPQISDEGLNILKLEEGFSKYPYWDYSQFTVGYGTRCPEDMRAEYTANGITEEAAEILLRNHLVGVYSDLLSFAQENGLEFTQNQFDALVLISYNCGTSWMFDQNGTLPKALKNQATGNELIRAFALWCSAGGTIKSYLLRRRLSEAYMYLEGGYTQNAPSNYCYVLYDANGGSTSPRSQGYDSNLTAQPYPVPTYSGYTFDGWYTQKVGGTKVTTLDSSTKSKTLYAHWKNAAGEDIVVGEEETEVNATVTSDGVNIRKGPGTNYTTVGTKNKGDKILITETASGSGYRWGKISEGWICLTYTDYDTTEEETTTPDNSTDTDTTPSTGTTVKGTITAVGGLNVRSGASTAHDVVGHLNNGEIVEILEQKTVGAYVWGRVSQGWISMTYVKLDSDTSDDTGSTPDDSTTATQTWTGTIINCSEFLRIRSGAGTNYSVVDYLDPGDRVTITEIKTVGSDKWGKIDRGWISMYYVKLDTTDSSDSSGSSNTTATTKTGTITASSLCIRSYAGTASTVVGYLNAGSRVTITQTTTVGSTTWGKIDKGWISMDYVKLDSTADSGTSDNTGSTQSVTGTITCSEYLNVRSGAGTDYSIAGYLYPGDQVTITEQKTVGSTTWGKTSKGWISMDYVKLDSNGSTDSSGTTSQSKTVTASCLCVRKTASTSGQIVGYLYYGAKVSILETTTVNGITWGRTSQGWICMDYVK